ncbi:MAG: hypothetical protein J6X71_02460 [Bacteroidales bacterium]|nr:hypothetical protein [Bacteroidales bacterium]
MKLHIHSFDAAGEAILASAITLGIVAVIAAQMFHRVPAFLLGLPFAWAFGEAAVKSWREALGKDTHVQPHSRRQGDVR